MTVITQRQTNSNVSKYLSILFSVTGIMGLALPVVSVGSQGDGYSLIEMAQVALKINGAGFGDSVRETMAILSILMALFVFASYAAGTLALRDDSRLGIVSCLPAFCVVLFHAYLLFETSVNGWHAEASPFGWMFLLLSVGIVGLQKWSEHR